MTPTRSGAEAPSAEEQRLQDSPAAWKRWGPYLTTAGVGRRATYVQRDGSETGILLRAAAGIRQHAAVQTDPHWRDLIRSTSTSMVTTAPASAPYQTGWTRGSRMIQMFGHLGAADMLKGEITRPVTWRYRKEQTP